MWAALTAILGSGATGGIVGVVAGLFTKAGERKERIRLREISLEQDRLEYAEAAKVRADNLAAMQKGAELKLQQTETEGEIAADITEMTGKAAAAAQEFKDLNTSGWVDNFRSLIRPGVTTHLTLIFTIMLTWAFWKYGGEITKEQGLAILTGLFATLEFGVTAAWSFYFVSRRNAKAHV